MFSLQSHITRLPGGVAALGDFLPPGSQIVPSAFSSLFSDIPFMPETWAQREDQPRDDSVPPLSPCAF